MLKLLLNGDVYAPEPLGKKDILISDRKITLIKDSLIQYKSLDGVKVYDLNGMKVVPGYIDQHIHITGGGGEDGYSSHVPEIMVEDLVSAGITTTLGLLGTDGITRSPENLFAKAKQLEEYGITTYMLTGSYSFPSKTITESILKDIVFIDNIIGVKIAIADHRSSNITRENLIALVSEARLGGIISSKSGITVMHMGSGKYGFKLIKELLEYSDVPIKNILPTHVGRSQELFEEAIDFALKGGNIDITASQNGVIGDAGKQVKYAISKGVGIERITISSDAHGSQPKFDENGLCIGLSYTTPNLIHEEIKMITSELDIPLEEALKLVTSNVARIMGLKSSKGTIQKSGDADILVLDKDMNIRYVFANGKNFMKDGTVLIKNRFKSQIK